MAGIVWCLSTRRRKLAGGFGAAFIRRGQGPGAILYLCFTTVTKNYEKIFILFLQSLF